MKTSTDVPRRVLCCILGIVIPLLCSPCAAETSDNEKTFATARAQLRLRKYEEALRILGGILDNGSASVGDKVVDDSRRLYIETVTMMASGRARKGQELEAVELLRLHGSFPNLGEQRELLTKRASTILKTALDLAIKKNDSRKIVQLAAKFPDEHLIERDELLQHELRMVSMLSPLAAFKKFYAIKTEGVSDKAMREAGLSEAAIVLRYAKSLKQREWYREASSLLRDQLMFGSLTENEKSETEQIEEQCLLSYAAACVKFQNFKMCQEALDLYTTGNRNQMNPQRVKDIERAMRNFGVTGEPIELKFPGKYVEGKGVWQDSGNGFFIAATVQTGNCANSRGGAWKTAKIEVAAGTVIEGGVLRASHGSLIFKGTVEKPVVLRNVRLECDYTASVSASNTMFVDCTFRKSGSWHWKGGFSSKWHFTDCMLVRSNFAHLSRSDYGLRWQGTTFLACKFPQRTLVSDVKKDAAREYRGHWNLIKECVFVECAMTPSLVWGCSDSAFVQCQVSGTSDFKSSKPLKVPLLVSPVSFTQNLKVATLEKGIGNVEYILLKSQSKALKRNYWKFVPELPRD